MAISIVKRPISGTGTSLDWIELSAATLTGTVLHTLSHTATTTFDKVYLYCNNTTTNSFNVNLSWGNTSNKLLVPIEAFAHYAPVISGLELWASTATSGVAVKAGYGSLSVSIMMYGHVTRYTET